MDEQTQTAQRGWEVWRTVRSHQLLVLRVWEGVELSSESWNGALERAAEVDKPLKTVLAFWVGDRRGSPRVRHIRGLAWPHTGICRTVIYTAGTEEAMVLSV